LRISILLLKSGLLLGFIVFIDGDDGVPLAGARRGHQMIFTGIRVFHFDEVNVVFPGIALWFTTLKEPMLFFCLRGESEIVMS
jgi:hypothetical protein